MGEDTKKIIIWGLILGLILFLAFIKISSWMTQKEATSINPDQKITLIYKDKTWPATFRDLGFRSDISLDEEKFDQFLKENLSSIETPTKDASLTLHLPSFTFHLLPSKEGLEINKTLLKLEIKENLAEIKNNPIELKLIKSYPQIQNSEVADVRMKAYQILGTPLKLSFNAPEAKLQSTWKVPQEEVASWIEFVEDADEADFGGSRGYQTYKSYWTYKTYPSYETYPAYPLNLLSSAESAVLAVRLEHQAIKDFITPLTTEINTEPINAELEIKNGKVVAFALSREGKRLEIEESAEKIQQALISESPETKSREASRDLVSGATEVQLVVTALTPQVTTESIDNLGITSLIGKGESDFAGSPQARIHNIKLSSAKLNGTLIKPGEEFSFNKTLGEVGPTEGYLPELVIKRDKTTPEFGGGICQVSTTLFRAALFSGLPITERFPHAFPVAYYWPQGMDATVYPPHPDLRFKNDTPEHILIQRKIIGTKLIFEFFGTSEVKQDTTSEVKRTVKIKGPYVTEKKEDGSMKTVLYREIYHDGELMKEEVFRSNYASPEKYPREE